jgi:hypothetical protein
MLTAALKCAATLARVRSSISPASNMRSLSY